MLGRGDRHIFAGDKIALQLRMADKQGKLSLPLASLSLSVQIRSTFKLKRPASADLFNLAGETGHFGKLRYFGTCSVQAPARATCMCTCDFASKLSIAEPCLTLGQFKSPTLSRAYELAGETGLEPATPGFGDQCSTN